jgi:RNA polymerase sigma-70 factor (ECF subfamily)
MNSPVTRPTLLIHLRDPKNAGAWSDFVRLYTPLVFGFCVQRGLQEADAADVCQEVMIAVAGGMGNFAYDPARGSFRSWLMRVTRNRVNSFFERSYRRAPANGSTSVMARLADQPTPEEEDRWETEYRRRMLTWASEQVRGEFAANTWEAFRQTAVEGKPGVEVAAALGMSVGAVYIARSRVMARLREKVASALKDFGLEPEW